MDSRLSARQQYVEWIEERLDDFKDSISRQELLALADEAVTGLFHSQDEQYPLTEILLRDAVDALIFQRLGLPTFRQWLRTCQTDTPACPSERTVAPDLTADGGG